MRTFKKRQGYNLLIIIIIELMQTVSYSFINYRNVADSEAYFSYIELLSDQYINAKKRDR